MELATYGALHMDLTTYRVDYLWSHYIQKWLPMELATNGDIAYRAEYLSAELTTRGATSYGSTTYAVDHLWRY